MFLGGHLLACQEVQEVLEVQVIPVHPKRSSGRKALNEVLVAYILLIRCLQVMKWYNKLKLVSYFWSIWSNFPWKANWPRSALVRETQRPRTMCTHPKSHKIIPTPQSKAIK